jgi:RNA polymerase sigma-70 factor (ECF subfamily)
VVVREDPAPPLPRAALEQLDALYRLARHLTGDDDTAEDLVQETYARALGKRAQFAPGTNVRAWLFRILRNLYVDDWRRAKVSPIRERLEDDDPADDPGAGREALRGDDELERLRSLVASDIESALAALPVDSRTIILLDMEGLTQEELAEVLGCNVGTVKSRLSRARAKLRERLGDYAR